MNAKKQFRKLLRDCVDSLRDLKFGKKVDFLYSRRSPEGKYLIAHYPLLLKAFAECVLRQAPSDSVLARKIQLFFRHLESLQKRIEAKTTARRKTITLKQGISLLSASCTKMLNAMDKERFVLSTCVTAARAKHEVHCELWPQRV